MPRPPIHPGVHLRIDLEEAGITQSQLAREIKVPKNRISMIVRGERNITADTALRLARWMGTTPEYWLNLQAAYDIRKAKQDIGKMVEETIVPRATSAA